jgi:hypothetical protein
MDRRGVGVDPVLGFPIPLNRKEISRHYAAFDRLAVHLAAFA